MVPRRRLLPLVACAIAALASLPARLAAQVPAASESTMAVSKVSTTKEAQRRMGAVRERREARLMRVVTPLTPLDAPTEELPGMGEREAAGMPQR